MMFVLGEAVLTGQYFRHLNGGQVVVRHLVYRTDDNFNSNDGFTKVGKFESRL